MANENLSTPSPIEEINDWSCLQSIGAIRSTMPDISSWPKISIVTPSYNQGQFIEETIHSVLLQDYPNLEFIIIDGGSTDNTVKIIKKYEPWIAYWVSEPDRGQSHAINKGIEKATGDILFWLNSDDLVLLGAFRRVAELFKNYPDVSIISGQARIINETGEDIGSLQSYFKSWEELITNPGNSIRQISTFFRRTLFDLCGNLDEELFISMDTVLISRFTEHHTPMVIPDELTAFRIQPNAKTSNQLLIGYEETDKNRFIRLSGKLRSKYRQRSSSNWINLAGSPKFSRQQKKLCLQNAVKMDVMALFRRKFWVQFYKTWLVKWH